MKIGFLHTPDDLRCPISAISLKKYQKIGVSVLAESKALTNSDEELEGKEGIEITSRKDILSQSDIVYCNTPLSPSELKKINKDAIVVSFYAPFNPENKMDTLKGSDVKAFSMDMIPRTTLAQSMDVLSSMASISGYKAVLLSAEKLPRYFPMMMTAAGTVKPAQVLILGAGVAGLQAIATARKLGAKVQVFDVRKAVKEEVQSLGAKFVEVDGSSDDKAAGGYAIEQSEDYQQRQKEAIHNSVKLADVVITTAQLRGREAPILVTKAMVEDMKAGSVIIDLASSTGGNCEVTKDNEEIKHNGVTVIGDSALYNKAIIDASSLLANNIHNYVATFVKEGAMNVDMENEIISGSLVHPKSE